MPADFVMSVNPQKITNTADTNDHTIDASKFVVNPTRRAKALIDNISGPVKFNGWDVTTASSASYTTTDKVILDVDRHFFIHFAGSAGSETFQITIINEI